ncbi:MAG: hypothetical protein ACTIJ6_04600 [Leucobacter sp.]
MKSSLDAQELAYVLREVIRRGVERRELHSCLGVGLTATLPLLLPELTGVSTQSRRRIDLMRTRNQGLRRAVLHARVGHDRGCETLGVSSKEVRLILERFDQIGAAALLFESFCDAVEELSRETSLWNPGGAQEVFEIHLSRRITPRPIHTQTAGPDTQNVRRARRKRTA